MSSPSESRRCVSRRQCLALGIFARPAFGSTPSVDDGAALIGSENREPITPRGERFRGQPWPIDDLVENPQRIATAIRTSWIARKLFVGHVGVILKWPRGLDKVNARDVITSRKLSGKPSAINKGREINVVHLNLGPIVRLKTSREELADIEMSFCSVEERTGVIRECHGVSLRARMN